MQQIVERENAPKETEETAREVGGSPGPSSSLELREEQGWEEQQAETAGPLPRVRGSCGHEQERKGKTRFCLANRSAAASTEHRGGINVSCRWSQRGGEEEDKVRA